MKPKDIILKIEEPPVDSFVDAPMIVTGWYDLAPELMIDEHLCELFPKLEDLFLSDLMEGAMEYNGAFTKDELKLKLDALGFKTIIV